MRIYGDCAGFLRDWLVVGSLPLEQSHKTFAMTR